MRLSLGNTVSRVNSGVVRAFPCLTFDGTDSTVIIPDNTDLDISTNLTVCAWAKNSNSNLSETETIVSKYENTLGNFAEWVIAIEPLNEKLYLVLSSDGDVLNQAAWESTSSISINSWNHYAFVFVGGTSLKAYVNGIEISGSFTTGSLPASLYNGTSDLRLGSIDSIPQAVWDGQICDVRIYNNSLSAAQILSIYGGGTPATGNLAAWYPLNEGSGTTATDVANGNNGTLTNFTLDDAWAVKQTVFNYTG